MNNSSDLVKYFVQIFESLYCSYSGHCQWYIWQTHRFGN